MKKTPEGPLINAWTHFWAGSPSAGGGCLPGLPAVVANKVHGIWKDFFEQLPLDARLLDLGTGNGVVLKLAKRLRPDLQLTGVDYAAALPDAGENIALYSETRMEKLPFADCSFDAVTGQFAIEYGDIPTVAKEVNRVLAPGGSYLFFCHHAAGVIVRDNSERLAAIHGLLAHAGLLETAIKAVRKRKKNDPAMRRKLAAIFDTASHKFTDHSVIQEVADDIARTMTGPDSLKKMLLLRRNVELEKDRLIAMQKSALDKDHAQQLTFLLSSNTHQGSLSAIHIEKNLPFAWLVSSGCI